MRRVSLFLLLAVSSRVFAFGQGAVGDWLPLHAGDSWIYLHENFYGAVGGIAHPEITRWKTEETVSGLVSIPEGTLVLLREHLVGPAPSSPHFELRIGPDEAWLIQGDCLFQLRKEYWTPSDHQLKPEFRKALSGGQVSADFCFPLKVGKAWGAPHWGDRPPAESKDWRVSGIHPGDLLAPDKGTTFRLASTNSWSYLGSGMSGDIWFEKGVGVVRDRFIHHGTFDEDRCSLIRFEPAR
jgi:hypothetical protein